MIVSVIVPYGGDDFWRRRSLGMLRDYYRQRFIGLDVRFHVSRNDDRPFNRARAVNRGVEETKGDVIVINDADSFVPVVQLEKAVRLAVEAPGLVRAYTRYRRLSQAATHRRHFWQQVVIADDMAIEWQQEPAFAHGVAAIQRACYLEAGGYDPKFTGWGYEDMAFELALDARWPDRRVPGDLFHHWHPSVEDPNDPHQRANADLYYNRYEPLRGNAAALLALRREDACPSPLRLP